MRPSPFDFEPEEQQPATGTEASEGFFNTDGVKPEGETVQPQPAKPPVDDGGPAYPNYKVDKWGAMHIVGGMSIRDYFAAAALQGMYAGGFVYLVPSQVFDNLPEKDKAEHKVRQLGELEMAHEAYKQADAMLAARKGGQS